MGMNIDCGICQHLDNPEVQLLSTDHWVVNLAPDQGYLGRSYITLRTHKGSLSELSTTEWEEYASIVKQLEQACTKAFGATPFNWTCLMNNAYQIESSQPHVHWHFRPRYKHSVVVNGQSFNDPDYGFHYDREHKFSVDSGTFTAIKTKIKANL